jgi:hypothetical protein
MQSKHRCLACQQAASVAPCSEHAGALGICCPSVLTCVRAGSYWQLLRIILVTLYACLSICMCCAHRAAMQAVYSRAISAHGVTRHQHCSPVPALPASSGPLPGSLWTARLQLAAVPCYAGPVLFLRYVQSWHHSPVGVSSSNSSAHSSTDAHISCANIFAIA